ncbi:MAG: ferrous iron transport protein A [Candidatus Latescibacteria bacterium]|nr:ferrous iron transport protein A [Candidatus Latescibacterota bacterium]
MEFFKKEEAQSPHGQGAGLDEGPLSVWQPGEEGVIAEVSGSSRLASRLREMGVVPGVHVRVLRTGSALVVQVDGGRLCLRRKDAVTIRVSSLNSALHPPPEGEPES